MKKIYAFLMMALLSTTLFAQNFVVSPLQLNGSPLQLMGEDMSQNRQYVAGNDQGLSSPFIWNTQNNEVMVVVVRDSAWREYDDGSGFMEYVMMNGSFHAVNNNGVAVGGLTDAEYVSHPIMATFNANGDFTYLYADPADAGCEAYDISADGSVIVGFYFDNDWTTYACIWNADGSVRTNLPTPTAEQVGFEIDYASARWISDDASTILGYVQDFNTGAWVAVAWKLVNGQYEVLPLANDYFQTTYFDDNGNFVSGDNPYFEFTPTALSANGEWVALNILEAYDPTDWEAVVTPKVACLNLNTSALQILDLNDPCESIEAFGVADNGTCAGRFTGELDWNTMEQEVFGFIWYPGETLNLLRIDTAYRDDAYCNSIEASGLSAISADGNYAMGYATSANGEWTTFIMTLPTEQPVGINDVEAHVALYPNPATTQVNVSVDNTIRTVNVVNAMGQVVMSQNGNNSNMVTVNTQNLPAGVYFVNVITDNGQATKRFTIVK